MNKKKKVEINETKSIKDTETENGTAESKEEKKEIFTDSKVNSRTKSKSSHVEQANKTVKKKRARIIEPIDSSDEEDHLTVR